MEGLPTADDVAFTVDNAEAVSEITKTDNTYTQTFKSNGRYYSDYSKH